MELNEIKKALYWEKPKASYRKTENDFAVYSCILYSRKQIDFKIPIEEITPIFKDDNGNYLPQMEAKHLIRWIKN